ncbi:MAG: 2-polyprenyl-6-methoxyphenol hydroxylase-like FAD-dependent oxidoreductase [Bacteriovoracaceae bacterium]|jgi:hypothetical protein
MWKLDMVLKFDVPESLLQTYEDERKPLAESVIEYSGELAPDIRKVGTSVVNLIQLTSL